MYKVEILENGSYKTLKPNLTKAEARYWIARIESLGGNAIMIPEEWAE